MKILVTGGAGYIGSFMTKKLLEENYDVTVVDSLEKGFREVVDTKALFVHGDFLNKDFVVDFFRNNHFEAIIHFAGYISMEESMQNPQKYFENNVFTTLNILDAMVKNNINNFIFSSTAGVYGNPIEVPISEDHQKKPTNPYGESKLMVERMLLWCHRVFNINYVSLRYFNAAGGAMDGSLGEKHFPETHLIPNIIDSVLSDREFVLYGDDYDTFDGTCIRDYIHVLDLATSHQLALEKIFKQNGAYTFNVGTGKGHSNREVLEMVKKISGTNLKIKISHRRAGDAAILIADPSRIKKELQFSPKYSDLETIVKSAWEWHRNLKKV